MSSGDTDLCFDDNLKPSDKLNHKVILIKVPNQSKKSRDQVEVSSEIDNEAGSEKSVNDNQHGICANNTQDFTVFLKESSVTLNVNNGVNKKKELEVSIPNQDKVVKLTFDYGDALKIDKTNPAVNIESVSELTWREMKMDYAKLPQYYMNLSKIRLTGISVICLSKLVTW